MFLADRILSAVTAASLLLCLMGGAAMADTFAPDFQKFGSEWVYSGIDGSCIAASGVAKITPSNTGTRMLFNQTLQVDDCTITASTQCPSNDPKAEPFGGIAFGLSDSTHGTVFEVCPSNGNFEIRKVDDTNTSNLAEWTTASAIKNSGWNDLKVTIAGKRATFYINNQLVKSLPIDIPAGGGMVGLCATSQLGAASQFKNFKLIY
jgi:hypothetical protein